MKILILSDDFPPYHYGGAGIVAYRLAHKFKELNHGVLVVTTVQEAGKSGLDKYEGLEVFRIYSDYPLRYRAYVSLWNFKVVKEVKRLIKEFNPDVVHCHNIHCWLSYACLQVAKKLQKPVFLTVHDWMTIAYGKLLPREKYKISFFDNLKQAKSRYNPLRNVFVRYFLKYVDKIFSVSNTVKEILKMNGIKNIETIYNGIEVNCQEIGESEKTEFKKKFSLEGKKIIFFAGRLSRLKGGEAILKTIKIVKEQFPDICLLVAGEKDGYGEKMLVIAEKLGLKKNFIITGWLAVNEMNIAYSLASVCVVPSIYIEPFGLMNIEAMSHKVPVITSIYGGGSEIIRNNIDGYVVNPSEHNKVAEKIVELLKNPSKAKDFGENGFKSAKIKFNLDLQVKKYLEYFKIN